MPKQLSLFEIVDENEPEQKIEMKPAEPTTQQPIDMTPLWSSYVALLTAWGPYVGRQGLWDNANNPERRHRVWGVVDSHFGGSLRKLKDRVNQLYYEFTVEYEKYQKVCQQYGVEPVSIKWMREHLWDGKDIESYRNRCKTRMNKPAKYSSPISLKDFKPRKK